jgi:hypothetical protein
VSQDQKHEEVIEDSTTAENIHAWKELMSSPEAKNFVSATIKELTVLFGQTPGSKILNLTSTLLLMIVSFSCIGLLGYYDLVTDGTTGALAGMIIGYFFKKGS